MRINRKNAVLYAALAGAFAAVITGCGSRQEEPPKPVASTTVGIEIDDTVVTAKVKSALLADPDIKSLDLQVETRKGTVQLSGFVDSKAQIYRAIAVAAAVEGAAAHVADEELVRVQRPRQRPVAPRRLPSGPSLRDRRWRRRR